MWVVASFICFLQVQFIDLLSIYVKSLQIKAEMSGIKLNLIKKHVELVEYIKSLIISIEWAPIINVSMKRRYEVFSAFMFIMMVLIGEIFCLYVLYLSLVSFTKFIIIDPSQTTELF